MGYIKNGKKLGVLGGMGPAASAEFLRVLARKCPAKCDQEHPIIYMIGDSEIPDRTNALLHGGKSPLERLKADLNRLCDMGADVLAVPCNTAHVFIDRFRDELKVELVHIIDETIKATKEKSSAGAYMISTQGTLHANIYQDYAAKHHLSLYFPNNAQSDKIARIIDSIKANELGIAGEMMNALARELWAMRDVPLMLACTELPLAYDASNLPKDAQISSIEALADGVVSRLYDSI